MLCRNVFARCFSYGAGALAAAMLGGISSVMADTLFVPALSLSGRYDSNIFSSPKIPGLRQDDWVSTVTPQLNILHQGNLAQGTLQLTGVGEQYLHNSGLNYFGGGANLNLNLSRLVQRYNPRLSLTISNSTLYTPQAPSFASPSADADPSIFLRGIQVVRVDTFSNSSSASLSYAFSQLTSFRVSYSYSVIRFGQPSVNAANSGVVNTNAQAVSAGPQVQLTARDSVFMSYVYQRSEFIGGQLPGFPTSFQTHGGTVGWSRLWSQEWRSNIFGGVSAVEEGQAVSPVGTASSNQGGGVTLAYSARASLVFSETLAGSAGVGGPGVGGLAVGGIGGVGGFSGPGGASIPGGGAMGMLGGASKMFALNYSAGVFPGYVAGGVPLLSHVISASLFRRLGLSWAVACSADYARNDSLSKQAGAQNLSFTGYGGNGAVSFFVTPTLFGSLTADYHKFEGQGLAISGAVAGGQTELDRFVGMLTLTKVWY